MGGVYKEQEVLAIPTGLTTAQQLATIAFSVQRFRDSKIQTCSSILYLHIYLSSKSIQEVIMMKVTTPLAFFTLALSVGAEGLELYVYVRCSTHTHAP